MLELHIELQPQVLSQLKPWGTQVIYNFYTVGTVKSVTIYSPGKLMMTLCTDKALLLMSLRIMDQITAKGKPA